MSASSAPSAPSATSEYIEYNAGTIKLSAYHFHHNREPFIIMFAKKDNIIYIEKIDPHSNRNKYVNEIVMPFEVMEKNKKLKKFYDMSVMLVNTPEILYYDTIGIQTRQIVDNYDTDSEDEEGEEIVLRRWFIDCDCVWKNLRVSKKGGNYNCYYNMNPFSYEYNVNTDKEINNFMRNFNAWAEYNYVSPSVENIIVANYNYQFRLIRS